MAKKFIITMVLPSGSQRFYTGYARQFTGERPDAREYPSWREAGLRLNVLIDAAPQAGYAGPLSIVEED